MYFTTFCELCRKKGKTPTAAILEMGLARSNYTNWKRGRIPKADVLQKVADYFGVTVDQLLGTEKAATSKGDGWSSQKTALYEDVDSMTDEELDDFMRLWNAWKAARSDKE